MNKKFEEILELLDKHKVDYILNTGDDKSHYSRYIFIRGAEVCINWWSNKGYVIVGDIHICCNNLELNNYWPIGGVKLSLRCTFDGIGTAIIPVKYYKEEHHDST